VRFEFESGTVSFCFSFIIVSLENHVCSSRGVQVAGAAWRAVTRTMAGGPGIVAQVGYSMAGRWRGRVAPCVVCIVHVETKSVGFLVEP
jgi:hypothetical protein